MRNYLFKVWLVGVALLAAPDEARSAVVAFPGAEGAGAYAIGGRGGDVYRVTNLQDEDINGSPIPGSFRYGIETATGPRTIIFDVSGTIELSERLKIDRSRLTIAGQTAPGDGICLKNYHVTMEANDLIGRYLRFRPGHGPYNNNADPDGLSIGTGTNMIADHISASWAGDENLSCTRGAYRVTVQWCLISEGLNYASHGYGSLIAPETPGTRISWHHNLYANNLGRTPRVGSRLYAQDFVFDYVNNVNYNWGTSGDWGAWGVVGGTPNEEYVDLNFVNNYSIAGTNTSTSTARNTALSSNFGTTRIYQSGNLIDSNRNTIRDGLNTGWSMFRGTYTQMPSPFPIPASNAITTTDPTTAYYFVLNRAGASLVRDAVDLRTVNHVRYQTGTIITSPTSVGGWPTLNSTKAPNDTDADGMPDFWERAVGLNTNVPNGNLDLNGDGYTQLEDYLNWRAAPHATINANGELLLDLRALNGSSGTNLIFSVANPTNGGVSVLANGYTARFVPATNFSGFASFDFTASEFVGVSLGTATVRIIVTGTNGPPFVNAVPGPTINAGSTLNATFVAGDPDQPPQTVTLSIPNLPAGAVFTPTNGALAWRPTLAQVGTNILHLVATDNGSPTLSSTQAYAVVVNRPPQPTLQSAYSNQQFRLRIAGSFGPDYTVQATTNLSDANSWMTVFTTNTPVPPVLWIDTNAGNFPRRFYRALLGP